MEVYWGPRAMHVVGDKFEEFAARHEVVVTLSEFNQMLDGALSFPALTDEFVLGQGLSVAQRELLCRRGPALPRGVKIAPGMLGRTLASHRTTHKVHARNILITEPEQLQSPDLYGADLVIDESCAELDDHVTGQHVSAALLGEAARQMCTAVLHGAALRKEDADGCYFLIDKLSASYDRYVLPLPARVICRLLASRTNPRSKSSRFSIRVQIVQCGVVATTYEASVAVFEKSFVTSLESQMASSICGEFQRSEVA